MKKLYALGRLRSGVMNAMEQDYDEYLKCLNLTGEVIWHKFGAMNLRLADRTFYMPDFSVMLHDGTLEIHEVKGVWIGDARTKIKVAADIYPFRFLAVTGSKVKRLGKKSYGNWAFEEI